MEASEGKYHTQLPRLREKKKKKQTRQGPFGENREPEYVFVLGRVARLGSECANGRPIALSQRSCKAAKSRESGLMISAPKNHSLTRRGWREDGECVYRLRPSGFC